MPKTGERSRRPRREQPLCIDPTVPSNCLVLTPRGRPPSPNPGGRRAFDTVWAQTGSIDEGTQYVRQPYVGAPHPSLNRSLRSVEPVGGSPGLDPRAASQPILRRVREVDG